MAYIKNIPIKKTVQACIKYITNPKKTNDQELITDSGFNFNIADKAWENIRTKFKKNDGILAHHFVQSFNPEHGVTPEEANRIGRELAERQFGKFGFDYIVATHVDTGVIHNHILVNSVSRTTGRKYNHDKRSYRFLRQLNIDVCRSFGVPAVDAPTLDDITNSEAALEQEFIKLGRKYRSKPYIKTHAYDSWSQKQLNNSSRIRNDINEAIRESDSWESFVGKMEERGYAVDWQKKSGEDKKFVTYTPAGAERGKRDRSLGMDWFSKAAIEKRIEENIIRRKRAEEYERMNHKTVKVTKVTVTKKVYVPKQQYYLDPNWDIKPLYFGKSKYRRRSYLETLLIRTFLKKKIAVQKQEKEFTEKSSTPEFAKINKELLEKSRKEVEGIMNQIKVMNQHGIKNSDDLLIAKKDVELKKFMLETYSESMKKELLDYDNSLELFKVIDLYKMYYDEYHSLEGNEKESYFYKNKSNIQQCAIAIRKLEFMGVNINKENAVHEKREKLNSALTENQKQIEVLEEELKELDNLETTIRRIESEKTQKKEKIVGKEKRDVR